MKERSTPVTFLKNIMSKVPIDFHLPRKNMEEFLHWYPGATKLNDFIELPDGRTGTICYNNLDGAGGVWGRHAFEMPTTGFGDELPYPDFMLREKEVEIALRRSHKADMECVGELFRRHE